MLKLVIATILIFLGIILTVPIVLCVIFSSKKESRIKDIKKWYRMLWANR